MTGSFALPSASDLAALLAAGPGEHEAEVWRPAVGDRPAAVLVPLLTSDGDLRVLLTRRSEQLAKHAGEYSFPGGRPEPSDASPVHTALRETHEEVGIAPSQVQVIGRLSPTSTYKTAYAIEPFVGLIEAAPGWVMQRSEVSQVAEPRIVDLLAGRTVHQFRREAEGDVVEMPVFPLEGGHAVWGATARILDDLLTRIASAVPR